MFQRKRKTLYCLKFITLLSILVNFSYNANSQELQDYKLGADDVLSITVFDEPDLSQDEVRVSSTGTITMPLIGQIKVKGLSISDTESAIYDLYLGDYLKKPDITVRIVEYRQFYVNGEVEKPGGYGFRDGMTVQRAITLAGGFTERASRTNITLIREGENGATRKVDLSTAVKPGDVITVEESFF